MCGLSQAVRRRPGPKLKISVLVGFVELMMFHPCCGQHRERFYCVYRMTTHDSHASSGVADGHGHAEVLEDLSLNYYVRQADGAYRDELVSRIILVCSRDKYAYLSDFVWYLNVLVQLARLRVRRSTVPC